MISQKKFISEVSAKARVRNKYIMRILRFLASFKKINHSTYSSKSIKPYVYLTICNEKSFPMLKASLYSFLKSTSFLPKKVVIVSDGSWETSIGTHYFSSFDVAIECIDWTSCAALYEENNPAFYNWANKQIWGKKMAAILSQAENNMVIFSDSDVLWYKNIVETTDFDQNKILKLTLDNSHNYDTQLLKKLNEESLFQKPAINCGVVKIKGDMFNYSSKLQQAIEIESKTPGDFSEQTMFALMVAEFGEYFTDEEITANIKDVIAPLFGKSTYKSTRVARHYVWFLKWLFWRDYISLI